MADAQFSGGASRTLLDGAAGFSNVSGTTVRAIYNYPADEGKVSALAVRAFTDGTAIEARASGLFARLLIRGRIDDPKVRVWTFTLDGHDYYVIRLGNIETLVYDTYSEQWSVYGDAEDSLWEAYQGINWIGSGSLSDRYGSNIIVGDDSNGALYFLNPEAYSDDDRVDGELTPRTFERVFQGQLTKRSYDYEKCYAVELLGSIGKMDQPTLTDVTLYISDDQGITYSDMGTITIPNESYKTRVDWRSLGSFTAPGRLFKIVDTGALHRVDSLTADTDRERS